jgi:hypothetical protein
MLLYDSAPSGNCYKVRLLLSQLGIPFERQELSVADRANRPAGDGERFHPREWKNPGDAAGLSSKHEAIRRTILAARPDFSLEQHKHPVCRRVFADCNLTRCDMAFFGLRDKPLQIGLRLVRERRDFAQIRNERWDTCWIDRTHWTFAKY